MPAVKAVAVQFNVEFGGPRKPKLLFARAEFDGGEFNGNMLARKTNLFDRLKQVRFQANHLIRLRVDPCPPGQKDRIAYPINNVRAKGVKLVLLFLEMNQPGWSSLPFSQPFTGKVKIRGQCGMKNEAVS